MTDAFEMLKNKFLKSINGGNETDVKTKAVIKNVVYSTGVKAANIGITYLTIPLLIGYLNETQYGVWLTIVTFTSWFALFDLGLGNGLKNKLVELLAQNDHTTAKKHVSTTFFSMVIICVVVGIVVLLFDPLISWDKIFNVNHGLKREVTVATGIVLVFTLINMLLRLSNNLLHAYQQSYRVDMITMLSQAAGFVALVGVKFLVPPSLIVVALAYSLSQILLLCIINVFLFAKYFKKFTPGIKSFDKTLIRSVSNISGQFFFIQIAGLVMYMTDNFIIANLFGPADVTTYNIALKYFAILTTAWAMLVVPLWPMITKAYYSKETPWINGTLKRMLKLWGLTIAGGGIMLLLSSIIYRLWLGKQVVIPMPISIALLIYTIVSIFANIMATFINGIGKIKLQAFITFFVAIINVPIAVVLSKWLHWGVVGVPAATTICLVISSIFAFVQVEKIISGKASGLWLR